MRPSLLTMPVVVETITAGATDDYGDPATTVTTSRTFPGFAWQASASERTGPGDLETQQWKLALDARADGFITFRSRVVMDGATFEVIGAPWTVRNPRTGLVSHVEATMRRTEG